MNGSRYQIKTLDSEKVYMGLKKYDGNHIGKNIGNNEFFYILIQITEIYS